MLPRFEAASNKFFLLGLAITQATEKRPPEHRLSHPRDYIRRRLAQAAYLFQPLLGAFECGAAKAMPIFGCSHIRGTRTPCFAAFLRFFHGGQQYDQQSTLN